MDHNRQSPDELPEQPIDRIAEPVKRLLEVESASGLVLLACTVIALALANSSASESFLHFWETRLAFTVGSFSMDYSLHHWVDDGLMAIFFFVIGLEVKREIVLGELREIRQAALPIAAALGGMLAPAGIYLLLQWDGPARHGWGIPMATDIAFVVGCMAILGSRIPRGLRVLILSLAIADDIGAILVIAIGYTASINGTALAIGFVGIFLVWAMERLGVRRVGAYMVVGVLVWLAFHESGVHATIAGVILGLMTPAHSHISSPVFARIMERAGDLLHSAEPSTIAHRSEGVRNFAWAARETVSPLEYLEHRLHRWVSFVIMPVFALANAGVPIHVADLTDPIAIAVAAGLVIGKPIGILSVSFLAVRVGVAQLPAGVSWSILAGGSLLAGIGFTMALFIAGLALSGPALDIAKVGILTASALAAVLGMVVLMIVPPPSYNS